MDYNIYNMNVCNSQHSVCNMLQYTNNVTGNPVCDTKNRYVYINQNFINANGAIGTKVLINPNFKPTVHINPNFKNYPKPKIHVNPNVLKLTDVKSVMKLDVENNLKDKLNTPVTKTKPIISTKTKLVRVVASEKPLYDMKHERRKSLHSKYKIIHSKENLTRTDIDSEKKYLKNIYKIDRNIQKPKKSAKRTYVKSKYSLQNVVSTSGNESTSSKENKERNSKYISINGTLYKKTPNVLRKADLAKITTGKANLNKSKVLLRKGKLYKIDHRDKSLKMLGVTVNTHFKKVNAKRSCDTATSKEEKMNLSVKLLKKRKLILRDTKSFTNQILINKMKKCNMPCPIYRKFGKCKTKELGKCIRVHNPNQIMMCTRFLQGACIDSKCLLSHKVSAEKMPTCKYFLEGLCLKEDCVYLHVKINAKADICKDFLEGFCKKAKECDKRHQFLCPEYEKNSSCPRKRCPYPHGNMVRKTKFLNKVAKRITKRKSTSNIKAKPSKDGDDNDEQIDKNVRYYTENSKEIESKSIDVIFEDNQDNKCNTVNDIDGIECMKLQMLKRAQLGVLPSYIPFGAEAKNLIQENI